MQATGGTTSRPMRMGLTRHDVAVYNEVGARAAWAAGLRPGDILFECMNYSLYAGGVNDHMTFETLGACVAPVGIGQSKRLLQVAADLETDAALYSTPSYAIHLAATARAEGIDPRELRIRKGLFSGDAGLEDPGLAGRPSSRPSGWSRATSSGRARPRRSAPNAPWWMGCTSSARAPTSPS